MKKTIKLLSILLLSFTLVACSTIDGILEGVDIDLGNEETEIESEGSSDIDEDGHYTSKEDVALYIHTHNKLPDNYIRKNEARDLGWEASQGNLWEVSDEKSIGGDRFGNREGKLPISEDRQYYECDINYKGGYRGAERLVYSNDGLIYYTDDHYDSFTLLYGDE